MHHNLNRVWKVSKVRIPTMNDIKFPQITIGSECEHFMNYRNSIKSGKTALQMSEVDFVQKLCKSAKPLIEHWKKKGKKNSSRLTLEI